MKSQISKSICIWSLVMCPSLWMIWQYPFLAPYVGNLNTKGINWLWLNMADTELLAHLLSNWISPLKHQAGIVQSTLNLLKSRKKL